MRPSVVSLAAALALALSASAVPAAAQTQRGWYLMSDGEDGGVRYVREVLIAAGKVKDLPRHPDATWTVYDVERREITLVDPARRTYARATPAGHCRSLSEAGDALQAALRSWSPDEPRLGSSGTSTTSAPEVSVRERTPRTRLQDFEEVLHEIRADGRWYRRVWLTTDARLLGALGGPDGLATYVDMRHELDSCSRELLRTEDDVDTLAVLVESSPAYLDVMRKGWPLNSAWNADGRQITEAVNIAAEWRVAASDLEPPDTYRELSLAEFLGIGGR